MKTETTASFKSTKCLVRGRSVALTPEEVVRQKLLYQMIQLGYPKGLIAVEKSIGDRRFDIVVFTRQGEPLLLVECKAKQAESALRQAEGYNATIGAPFLCIADEKSTTLYWQKGSVPFIPAYKELCLSS